MFLQLQWASKPPGDLVKNARFSRGLQLCIPNKLPGDAEVAGARTTL